MHRYIYKLHKADSLQRTKKKHDAQVQSTKGEWRKATRIFSDRLLYLLRERHLSHLGVYK